MTLTKSECNSDDGMARLQRSTLVTMPGDKPTPVLFACCFCTVKNSHTEKNRRRIVRTKKITSVTNHLVLLSRRGIIAHTRTVYISARSLIIFCCSHCDGNEKHMQRAATTRPNAIVQNIKSPIIYEVCSLNSFFHRSHSFSFI